MSYSDIEHFATMVSGCESLTNGNPKSAEAGYALTVLKLHANDAGLYVGQEGFLDHVKKGAGNVKQWIIALVKAIKEYLTSAARRVDKAWKNLTTIKAVYGKLSPEDKKKADDKLASAGTTLGKAIEVAVTKLKDAKEETESDAFGAIDFNPALEGVIHSMTEAFDAAEKGTVFLIAENLKTSISKLDAVILATNNKLSSFVSGEETNEKSEAAKKVGAWVNKVGSVNENAVKLLESISGKVEQSLDAFMGK